HGNGDQPDRDAVSGEEIVAGGALPARREVTGDREDQDVAADDRPIESGKLRAGLHPPAALSAGSDGKRSAGRPASAPRGRRETHLPPAGTRPPARPIRAPRGGR